MAGEAPGRVPVYTALKKTSRHAKSHNCGDFRSFFARLDSMTSMVMSPYRNTSHFSLRHLSFNLNREVVVVGAKNVVAAVPVIEHADTPNVLLVQEGIDGVLSFIGIATPKRIVCTIGSETSTITRHGDASTCAAH